MANILVVDDEPTVCRSCERILNLEGHQVNSVQTGQAALSQIQSKDYQVVITDLKMPGIDGMTLLEKVKDEYDEVDVIMITGYASVDTAVQAMRLGAFDYIPKPFTPNDLRAVTSRALDRRRLLDEARERAARTHVTFEYTMPDNLYYLPEHTWAKPENGSVLIGIDDVFQKSVGRIVRIKPPSSGDQLEQGKLCAEIEDASGRTHKLWSPVGGKVIEVNEKVLRDQSLLGQDPYGAGWIARISPSNLEPELKNLLHGEALVKWWLRRELVERKEDTYVTVTGLDPNFKFEIARRPGGENIKVCFRCGICTASCPVREIDETYNPRKIIRMALLGMRQEVLKSDFIWLCSTCYTCAERCPQGVSFTDVISAIKNIAAEEGYIHPALRMQAHLLKEQATLYEIDDFDNRKRERAGLPKIRVDKTKIKRIFESTGFSDLLEKKKDEL
jgi:heterodisulfide reductase subunit C